MGSLYLVRSNDKAVAFASCIPEPLTWEHIYSNVLLLLLLPFFTGTRVQILYPSKMTGKQPLSRDPPGLLDQTETPETLGLQTEKLYT